MSDLSRPLTKADKQALQKEFRAVLEEFGVVSKADMEAHVSEKFAELKKAQTPPVPEDLRKVTKELSEGTDTPYDEMAAFVNEHAEDFRAVRRALKRKEDLVSKSGPVLDHINDALEGSTTPTSEPSTNPTVYKGRGVGDTVLNGLYASLVEPREFKPIRKSSKGTETPAGLMAVEEAEDL